MAIAYRHRISMGQVQVPNCSRSWPVAFANWIRCWSPGYDVHCCCYWRGNPLGWFSHEQRLQTKGTKMKRTPFPEAEVDLIEDSISPQKVRLRTYELRYW